MSERLSRIAGAPITLGVDASPGWGHIMDRDRVMSEIVEADFPATELGHKADAELGVRFHETMTAEVVRFPASTAGEDRAPHRGSTEGRSRTRGSHTQRKEH